MFHRCILMIKFRRGVWKKMQSWKSSKRCSGWKHAPVNLWSQSAWFLSVPSIRYSSPLQKTLRSGKQLLHSDTLQEIIDDPFHGILRRHVGKSFSIFDLADETNAPGLLCQFSLLRVKQSGFPGPAYEASTRAAKLKMSLVLHKMVQCSISFSPPLLFVFDRVVIGSTFIFIEQVTPERCGAPEHDGPSVYSEPAQNYLFCTLSAERKSPEKSARRVK